MLLAGDYKSIPNNKELIIYNLTSLVEGYPILGILPPVDGVDYINELDFDIAYANYIMLTDTIFYEFFSKIIYPLYNGYDIYLITTRNIFYDNIIESLFKLIQQRYGYIGAILGEPGDIDYINPDMAFGTLGITGILNLDIDKERYAMIYALNNMNNS